MNGAKKAVLRGTARRVIIVPQPGSSAFEQAIFILRPDAPQLSEAELMREALAAAGGEPPEGGKKRRRWG